MAKRIYVTMAPNSWGRAATQEQSIKNCRKQHGAGMKDFDVWEVHPDTTIGDLGDFSYPRGTDEEPFMHRPIKIRSVRKGKELPIKT